MNILEKIEELLKLYPNFNLFESSIVLAYRGSISHGTHIPNSNPHSIDDIDIIGIAMPPKNIFFGLNIEITEKFQQFELIKDEWDLLVYDFRKAVNLLLKHNPNILSILWMPEKYILKTTPIFEILKKHREFFVTKDIYRTFCGYSQDQLKNMEKTVYTGYMGKKRKYLVDLYGYDTKNAQHLIRLLRQGIEFLKTGELIVERPDAQELIDIKLGKWSIEQVKIEGNKLFQEMKEAYNKSSLPPTANMKEVNNLVVDINYKYYNEIKY